MGRAAWALAVAVSALSPQLRAQDADSGLSFSGYYKNLLTRSRTFIGTEEDFVLDLNRVRVKLDGRPVDHLALDLEYDNELFLGDYLSTEQWALLRHQAPDTRFDLEDEYAHGQELLGRQRLYRASMTWSVGSADLTMGRQRVAWGTGRFWSPLDILNPLDPLRLEREERVGVDAALLEVKRGALGRVAVVYAPATSQSSAATAGYLHGNARGTDYSLMIGDFRGDHVIGADFSGRIQDLGIRGEVTRTDPKMGADYTRALLGFDYGWPNTLNLSAEIYFDGHGVSDPASYDFAPVLAGRTPNVARRYAALSASYEITPLLKVNGIVVMNLDDDSHVLWPALEWSLADNLDLSAGVQHVSGGGITEYGRLHNLWYAQFQWFF